jgi:predicted nuclease of predicted toxin-antitoxin system
VAERPTLFVDRSLGKGVGQSLREIGATVVLHDDEFEQTTPDADWIPEVTARGWVILTKDKNIRRAGGEREDVLKAGARVFTLTSGRMSGQQMSEVFISNLDEIERIAIEVTPPFAYSVGPNGCQEIPITPSNPPEPTPPEAIE